MTKAAPSQVYQMTPQEVGKKLCAVSSHTQRKDVSNSQQKLTSKKLSKQSTLPVQNQNTGYLQKSPKKIWDNLSFDLIMANDESPLWGWSDADAVNLLDYWAEFDEEMVFILTYDKPDAILKHLLGDIDVNSLNELMIENKLKDWIEYNQALISFYQKYSNRSLLVNGEQVLESARDYINSVAQIAQVADIDALQGDIISPVIVESTYDNSPTIDFLIRSILSDYDGVHQVFSELQSLANMPLSTNRGNSDNMLDLLKESVQKQNELIIACRDLDSIKSQGERSNQEWQDKLKTLEQEHDKDRSVLQELQVKMVTAQQESSLLIGQLHQTQEELEKYYFENKKSSDLLNQEKKKLIDFEKKTEELTKKSDELNKSVAQLNKDKLALNEQKAKLEELVKQETQKLDQLKKQKNEELAKLNQKNKQLIQEKESLQANQISPQIKQENEWLIKQLHQVQEEMERYYLENQKLKAQKQEVAKPVYYGAADRVKEDLPYRLGATMVSHSKSAKDLAALPLALAKEYHQFQKNQPADLPAIEEYQDASEAEKVKKHLSYRLGRTLVDGLKSPKSAIDLPVKLGKEIVGFGKK